MLVLSGSRSNSGRSISSSAPTSRSSSTRNDGNLSFASSARGAARTTQVRQMSTRNFWGKVTMGPEDPILGVTVAFNKDTSPKKINLGVGAYRDDNGKPFILECVKKAEQKIISENMNHEYAPINGLADFNKASQELVFGKDHPAVKDKRIVTIQALSGTGALRVGADFMNRFLDIPEKTVWMPKPTWGNHLPLFTDAGFKLKEYRYYDAKTCGLDFKAMAEDIKNAPNNSLFLFHACAHNPTGVDPNPSQWAQLSQICKEKDHFVFFDLAYQGFASGDPQKDAQPIHTFVNDGHDVGIAQSFAKNFGLYGERIGAVSFMAPNAQKALELESQLKILVRPMYSNPPIYGARVVSIILNSPELTTLWRKEVKGMADRIIGVRTMLVDNLKSLGSKRDWSHITNQIGMFCFSGLTPEQVDKLAADYHIYLTRNGRISMAGVTSKNVGYLAEAIHAVTK